MELTRGTATIPLPGISVPFHSRFLMPGVPAFRNCLKTKIESERVKAALTKLEDRYVLTLTLKNAVERSVCLPAFYSYVPNVVAIPFRLTREFAQAVFDATQSKMIKDILADWDR